MKLCTFLCLSFFVRSSWNVCVSHQLIHSFNPFLLLFAHSCIDNKCFFRKPPDPVFHSNSGFLSPIFARWTNFMEKFVFHCAKDVVAQVSCKAFIAFRCMTAIDATDSSRKKWISATARREKLQGFESVTKIHMSMTWPTCKCQRRIFITKKRTLKWSDEWEMETNVKNAITKTIKHSKAPQSKKDQMA